MVSNPLTDPEWADRSVDLIDRVISRVRRYTTQPIVATARGLVFGLLAGFGIIAVIVVLGVGITRGLQEALDAAMNALRENGFDQRLVTIDMDPVSLM